MNPDDLGWRVRNKEVTVDCISSAAVEIGITFPSDYVECARRYHGSSPANCSFSFPQRKWHRSKSGLGRLLSFRRGDMANIVNTYHRPSPSLPPHMIPFASTGGGDYVCFNYNEMGESGTPSVVYWVFDRPKEDAVIFVAATFSAFLEMLQEPQDCNASSALPSIDAAIKTPLKRRDYYE